MDSATKSTPILIWGAGTASAQYIIQILTLLGFNNIISTAWPRSSARAFALGATHVLDYNDPKVADQIESVGAPIKLAVDTICTENSLRHLSKVVNSSGSKVALLVPIKIGDDSGGHINQGGTVQLLRDLPQEHNPFNLNVNVVPTYTFTWESVCLQSSSQFSETTASTCRSSLTLRTMVLSFQNLALKDTLMISILPELLRSRSIKSQPVRIINTGSLVERVREAAALVKNNSLNGEKAVIDFTL